MLEFQTSGGLRQLPITTQVRSSQLDPWFSDRTNEYVIGIQTGWTLPLFTYQKYELRLPWLWAFPFIDRKTPLLMDSVEKVHREMTIPKLSSVGADPAILVQRWRQAALALKHEYKLMSSPYKPTGDNRDPVSETALLHCARLLDQQKRNGKLLDFIANH